MQRAVMLRASQLVSGGLQAKQQRATPAKYGFPEVAFGVAAAVCPLGNALLTPSLPLHFPSHESESPEQIQSKGWLRFDKFHKVH